MNTMSANPNRKAKLARRAARAKARGYSPTPPTPAPDQFRDIHHGHGDQHGADPTATPPMCNGCGEPQVAVQCVGCKWTGWQCHKAPIEKGMRLAKKR